MAFRPSAPPLYDAPRKHRLAARDLVALADALECAGHALRAQARMFDQARDLSPVMVTLANVARAWNTFAARLGDAEARS
jgi:hypothetical protein